MSNNSDLISRQAVIRAIRNHINVNRERADRGYAAMIREEDIEIIEGIEPTTIVKCRDCKHWLHDVPGCTEHVGRCEWANWMCGENGFCLYAEEELK